MAKKRGTKRSPARAAKARGRTKKRSVAPRAKTRRAPKRAPRARSVAVPPSPPTVVPYLCCKGALAALDFYVRGFGAEETMRVTAQDGSIGHAQVEIAGAPIMLSDEWPDGGVFSPETVGGTPVTVHLYVPDVDAFVARAVTAGASVLRDVADQPYGDRSATLRDPLGHRWMVATRKESLSKPEMERRFGGAYTVT